MQSGAQPELKVTDDKYGDPAWRALLVEKLVKDVRDYFNPDRYKEKGLSIVSIECMFLPKVTEDDLMTLRRNLHEVLEKQTIGKFTDPVIANTKPDTLRAFFTNDYGKQALEEKLICIVKASNIVSCLVSQLMTEQGLRLLRNTRGIIPLEELCKLGCCDAMDSNFTELQTALKDGHIYGIQQKTANRLGGMIKIVYEKEKARKASAIQHTAQNEMRNTASASANTTGPSLPTARPG
ncbi:MAG TPA: hypothetical protein VLJ15_01175 [Gammaproteobacteria bacterium]|nr:hypothetical protein [Gammaproteobacteria bacterium]